ncbi:hypothetical protein VOM14_08165 [Paraburkholderia sp. MPAMCS5]|uniref:hypothetical protein n=1 Tax=Paraburkholderia sp. MPAMCS5 TaxID=3112563 RepID=UPI002E19488F|nr:hypothetical protein [Paraburkholderia sp. MPAMCS5]
MKRTAGSKQVVAVRVTPQIEQRLRLLAEVTGRKQSFFIEQIIESGIGAIEATWLPSDVVSQIREGTIPSLQQHDVVIADLFDGL